MFTCASLGEGEGEDYDESQFIQKNECSVYAIDRFGKGFYLLGSGSKHSPMLKKMFPLQDSVVNEGWTTTFSRRDY